MFMRETCYYSFSNHLILKGIVSLSDLELLKRKGDKPFFWSQSFIMDTPA